MIAQIVMIILLGSGEVYSRPYYHIEDCEFDRKEMLNHFKRTRVEDISLVACIHKDGSV